MGLIRKYVIYVNTNTNHHTNLLFPNMMSILAVYFDIPAIINLVDIVHLSAYDFETPERNPKEADYATPLYTPQNRNPLLNADAVVNHW